MFELIAFFTGLGFIWGAWGWKWALVIIAGKIVSGVLAGKYHFLTALLFNIAAIVLGVVAVSVIWATPAYTAAAAVIAVILVVAEIIYK